jgi:hypothetical protein
VFTEATSFSRPGGSEQSRVYRATINGIISTTDGARLMFMLRERRCTQEAIDAQVAAAAAALPPPPSTVRISIGTVPSGCYFTKEAAEKLHNGTLLLENESAVSAEDYTRAVSSRRADDELDAAVDATAANLAPGQPHEPIEADAADNNGFRRQTATLAEPPAPKPAPVDRRDANRPIDFEFSRPPRRSWYDQHH